MKCYDVATCDLREILPLSLASPGCGCWERIKLRSLPIIIKTLALLSATRTDNCHNQAKGISVSNIGRGGLKPATM